MFAIDAIAALANNIVTGISGYFKDQTAVKLAQFEIEKALIEFARQVDAGQIELNKEESKSQRLFVAGWRPFIGWMGGVAMAYQFLLRPLINGITWVIDPNIPELPVADLNEIIGLVGAMLGVAGLRSYEKIKLQGK